MAIRKAVGCLLLAFVALLVTTTARARDVPISEQAKLHFAVGVSLLEDPGGPRYAEAYESFRRAYRASPSPKILSNLGLCAMHLERDGEAIKAYELYLDQVDDIPPAEKKRIHVDLKRLHAGVATLLLNIQPVGAIITDKRIPDVGDSVINRYKFDSSTIELGVRAGKHEIKVEADGYETQTFEAEVAPGDKHLQKVKLKELPGNKKKKKKPAPPDPDVSPEPSPQPDPEPRDTGGGGISGASIAMIAVTGALTVGAVVVGALSLQAKADYNAYQSGGSRVDAENIRLRGEALNITTDVLIATAVASAAVTVVLLFTTDGGDESAALKVAPAVGGGTIGLDVRF